MLAGPITPLFVMNNVNWDPQWFHSHLALVGFNVIFQYPLFSGIPFGLLFTYLARPTALYGVALTVSI